MLFGKDASEFPVQSGLPGLYPASDDTRMGTPKLFTIAVDHQKYCEANTEADVIAAYTSCARIVTMAYR